MTRQEQAALNARLDALVEKLDQHQKYEDDRRKELHDKIDNLRGDVRAGFAEHGERLHRLETTMSKRQGWTQALGWAVSVMLLLAGSIGAFITWGV